MSSGRSMWTGTTIHGSYTVYPRILHSLSSQWSHHLPYYISIGPMIGLQSASPSHSVIFAPAPFPVDRVMLLRVRIESWFRSVLFIAQIAGIWLVPSCIHEETSKHEVYHVPWFVMETKLWILRWTTIWDTKKEPDNRECTEGVTESVYRLQLYL